MSKELIEKLEAKAAELLEVAGELKNATAGKAEIEKWEPEDGDFVFAASGAFYGTSDSRCRDYGIERKTREQAKSAYEKARTFNRLLAYVDEHAPGWEPEWSDIKERKWYVYFDHTNQAWGASFESTLQDAGKVYMPREVAEELANKLNSGEVEL